MMSKYESMTDLEINTEVANQLHGCKGPVGDRMPNGVKAVDSSRIFYTEADYCNNPSDAWPLIVDNKIGVHWLPIQGGIWSASLSKGGEECGHETNPLRAAMIVFLMMKDSDNEN